MELGGNRYFEIMMISGAGLNSFDFLVLTGCKSFLFWNTEHHPQHDRL